MNAKVTDLYTSVSQPSCYHVGVNTALKALIAGVPRRTIRAVAGSVAVGGAAGALAMAGLSRQAHGGVVSFALMPFLLAVAACAVVAIIRLRVVDVRPSDAHDDDMIPRHLEPWIRSWLLVRFGLLGSGLLLIVGGVAAAVAQRQLFATVAQAFVYVVCFRLLMDALMARLLAHART